ncbi:BatA domain-containing protein [Marinoscillum sp. MHG1-6]|uniref:BatA domain-containing protein n=1 Tax=Marinoscillum sp. MHG1-6 TaxID=2959627 RepID=UPI002157955F|nr:BatA domain-containing protein [Marinoscillum sp. MHG1-6]
MSFLNPVAFWLFSLLIIPVIIHLFNFRKARVVYFSNVSFLTEVKSSTNSSNNLKKYLVLLLRLLAFSALVLALSQPIFIEDQPEKANFNQVIYLDNSYSMGRMTDAGGDLLSSGVGIVERIAEKRLKKTTITTNNFEGPLRPINSKEVGRRLTEIPFSYANVTFDALYEKVRRVAGVEREMYVISDFQESTLGSLKEALEDSLCQFNLVKLKPAQSGNIYIDSVALEDVRAYRDGFELRILISNIGEAKSGVLIKIVNEESQIASFTEDLGANSKEWIKAELPNLSSRECTIMIEDATFSYDNKYHLVFPDQPKLAGFQLYDNKPNKAVSSVFLNEEYFNLDIQSVGSVDTEKLQSADFVILDGLKSVPDWIMERLRYFDKPVVVFPAEGLQINSYESLTGAQLTIDSEGDEAVISQKSLEHPLFGGIFSPSDVNSRLPKFKPYLIIPRGNDVILKSQLNAPLLTRFGDNIYLFASPLMDSYTNLHQHALFLPLMYELTLKREKGLKMAFDMDSHFLPIKKAYQGVGEQLRLVSKNESIVPVLRSIQGESFIELPIRLSEPGFYYLTSWRDTLESYAINMSKKESQLEAISDEQLKSWENEFDNVSFISTDASGDLAGITGVEDDMALWKYALILALIFLIAEQTLLRILK